MLLTILQCTGQPQVRAQLGDSSGQLEASPVGPLGLSLPTFMSRGLKMWGKN